MMPQLDQATYFSQFFWLCVFYFIFYLLIVKFFLPKMSRILKVRSKNKAVSDSNQNSSIDGESRSGMVLMEAFQEVKKNLVDSTENTLNRVNLFHKEMNQSVFQSANLNYLQSIGTLELSFSLVQKDMGLFSKKAIASTSTDLFETSVIDVLQNTFLWVTASKSDEKKRNLPTIRKSMDSSIAPLLDSLVNEKPGEKKGRNRYLKTLSSKDEADSLISKLKKGKKVPTK